MATNPATQPGAEPVQGDNLTSAQAAFLIAWLNEDPDDALEAAQEFYEAAGYPDAESFVDELVTYLSEAAGEPDDSEADEEQAEADPEEEVAA